MVVLDKETFTTDAISEQIFVNLFGRLLEQHKIHTPTSTHGEEPIVEITNEKVGAKREDSGGDSLPASPGAIVNLKPLEKVEERLLAAPNGTISEIPGGRDQETHCGCEDCTQQRSEKKIILPWMQP